MTRDDLEATMSFIAERAMEAEAVGNRDVSGSMRMKWHELKDKLDVVEMIDGALALAIVSLAPVERIQITGTVETPTDAPGEIEF